MFCSFKEIRARTYIQRHYGTGLEFIQTWIRYRDGFGDMFSTAEQFWLGNQYLYYITYYSSNYTLVSEMGNRDTNEIRQQEYTQFYVLSEVSEFRLFFNASSIPLSGLPALSDCLIFAEHTPFSTFDHDSSLDECESGNIHGSGWWFAYSPINCGHFNPNGVLVQFNDRRRTDVENEEFLITDWSPWYIEMWLECRV